MAMPKILIVDDEPHIRRLLQETLEDFEDQGVLILFAQNGVEAVEMIVREKPEVVYLDIMMPLMNGYEVCNKVRNELQMHEMKVVMLTAKGQIFDKKKGLDLGVDLYITKPFDPDYIVEITEKFLGIQLED